MFRKKNLVFDRTEYSSFSETYLSQCNGKFIFPDVFSANRLKTLVSQGDCWFLINFFRMNRCFENDSFPIVQNNMAFSSGNVRLSRYFKGLFWKEENPADIPTLHHPTRVRGMGAARNRWEQACTRQLRAAEQEPWHQCMKGSIDQRLKIK